MRRLTAMLLATGLAMLGPGTHADDEGASLQCGVQFGGSELAYRPASTATRRAGAVSLRPAAWNPAGRQEVVFPEAPRIDFHFRDARAQRRLPAVLAVARIGCSWR